MYEDDLTKAECTETYEILRKFADDLYKKCSGFPFLDIPLGLRYANGDITTLWFNIEGFEDGKDSRFSITRDVNYILNALAAAERRINRSGY